MHQLLQLKGKELLFWWHVSLALCQRCERCTSFLYKVSVFEPLISRTCVLFPAYQVKKKKKEKEIWCRLTDLVFLVEEAMCSFSSQRLCAAIRWECKIQAMTPMWCCFFFFFVLCLPRFCKRGRESLMPLYRVCFKTMNARFTLHLFSPTPLYVLTVLKEV